MTDPGGNDGTREPSEAAGMTSHAGAEGARSHSGVDELMGRGRFLSPEDQREAGNLRTK